MNLRPPTVTSAVIYINNFINIFSKAEYRHFPKTISRHFLHKALHASEGSKRIFSSTGPSKGHPKKVYLLVPVRKRQEENRDGR